MARSSLKVHGQFDAGDVGRSAEIICLDEWRKPPAPISLSHPRVHPEHWLIGLLAAACYAVGISALF